MSDALRYRLIDEPRPGPLQRIALPPLLVFLAAQFFLQWAFVRVPWLFCGRFIAPRRG